MAIVLAFDDGKLRRVSLDEVPALLEKNATIWIDTQGGDDRIPALLTEVLKIHPLAVEDILEVQPTPKIEDYGDYLYIVAHGIDCKPSAPTTMKTVEVDVVFSKRWVFTHHDVDAPTLTRVRDELERNARPMERGAVFVAHAILDHVVDAYMPAIDALDDEVEAIEAAVIDRPSHAILQRLFDVKRVLQGLRRTSLHQREVLQRLARGEFDVVGDDALPFFRDVHDHFVRVVDLADSYRELLSNALDAYLSVVSNRMNEVMKTLTIVATLMMPMTFIVGVYGMNFDHMPELHWRYGYLYCWLILIAVFFAMLGWFRKRRWI